MLPKSTTAVDYGRQKIRQAADQRQKKLAGVTASGYRKNCGCSRDRCSRLMGEVIRAYGGGRRHRRKGRQEARRHLQD